MPVRLPPPVRRVVLRVVPPAVLARLRRRLASRRTDAAAHPRPAAAPRRAAPRRATPRRSPAGREGEPQFLLVVAYGRSGSTLLQGILNAIPGYLIRGENRDALDQLRRFHGKLLKERRTWQREEPLDPRSAWFGIDEYRADLALSGLRAMLLQSLLRPDPDTRVIGYKEIRWMQEDPTGYWNFLESLFPNLRVIINERDHERVLRSSWWASAPSGKETLQELQRRFDTIAERFGDRAYRLNFDEWSKDPAVLEGLFDWLGEDFDLERVRAVMSRPHST